LKNVLCYYFGHFNIVYFAGPGKVEDLVLKPGQKNIILDWKKPSSNGDCVTKYGIEWANKISGRKNTSSVSSDEFSEKVPYTIEGLDACVEYAVSVTAVNANGDRAEAVTEEETTETAGNYHTHYFVMFIMWLRLSER
jgi:hypothetical protein